MRLFVGLRPDHAAIADLAAHIPRLGLDRVRATDPDSWHVTLAFIGELADHRVDDVTEALTESSRGVGPFELRLTGGKVLGRSATVLCLGVDGDVAALRDLVADVRAALVRFRVPFDDREFDGHLTLARTTTPALAPMLAAKTALLDDYDGKPWTVADMALYRSRLGPPVSYEVVCAFPL